MFVSGKPEDGVLTYASSTLRRSSRSSSPSSTCATASVVGYEALARGRNGDGAVVAGASCSPLAREQGEVGELDRACREAALAGAQAAGLGAPFCLFVNADAGALEDDVPGTPAGRASRWSWRSPSAR